MSEHDHPPDKTHVHEFALTLALARQDSLRVLLHCLSLQGGATVHAFHEGPADTPNSPLVPQVCREG